MMPRVTMSILLSSGDAIVKAHQACANRLAAALTDFNFIKFLEQEFVPFVENKSPSQKLHRNMLANQVASFIRCYTQDHPATIQTLLIIHTHQSVGDDKSFCLGAGVYGVVKSACPVIIEPVQGMPELTRYTFKFSTARAIKRHNYKYWDILQLHNYTENHLMLFNEHAQMSGKISSTSSIAQKIYTSMPYLHGVILYNRLIDPFIEAHYFRQQNTRVPLMKLNLNLSIKVYILYLLALRIRELHYHGFVHQDIKADNVVVDFQSEKISVRLVDTDTLIKANSAVNPWQKRLMKDVNLTAHHYYIDPNMLVSNYPAVEYASDIFSFGALMLNVLGYGLEKFLAKKEGAQHFFEAVTPEEKKIHLDKVFIAIAEGIKVYRAWEVSSLPNASPYPDVKILKVITELLFDIIEQTMNGVYKQRPAIEELVSKLHVIVKTASHLTGVSDLKLADITEYNFNYILPVKDIIIYKSQKGKIFTENEYTAIASLLTLS